MSFPLASTLLSVCQDKVLVHTQFMVTSANNITPSLASSNEDLALANSLKRVRTQLSDGNRGVELRTVDTEPASHDNCRLREGVEFVFPHYLSEVGECEVGTQQEI